MFVGGTFTGSLAATGTVTLIRDRRLGRRHASRYGGAGWPDASTGQSLELVDPTSDNSLGSSWALSTGAAGSPGAANQAAVVGTPAGRADDRGARGGRRLRDGPLDRPGRDRRHADHRLPHPGAGHDRAADRHVHGGIPDRDQPRRRRAHRGVAYQFQVAAINGVGAGPFSALSTALTPVNPSATSRPVIGTAAAGAAGGAVTATARWTPPTSTGSAPITAYEVTALLMSSTAPNATVIGISTFPVLGPTIRSKVLTLTPGIYRFQVVALNAVGFSPSSVMSNAVTAQ